MSTSDRIEAALRQAMTLMRGSQTPPALAAALEHAVFAGGGRVRPRLVLAVAAACGEQHPDVAAGAAAAVELLHCASLVHDDLPCFDDADVRRGRPSVHAAFGEPLAVLAGDGLIVGAFEVLASACRGTPKLLPSLLAEIAAGVGAARGIVAGQGWESEAWVDLRVYHRTKTAALFVAAVRAGAIAGGGAPEAWTELGLLLGEAYQLSDDIADASDTGAVLDKPTGRDAALDRPNAVRRLGADGAHARLDELRGAIAAAIPQGSTREPLWSELERLCARLMAPLPRQVTAA